MNPENYYTQIPFNLTVDKAGMISLWDFPAGFKEAPGEVAIKLSLTPEQLAIIETARAQAEADSQTRKGGTK